MLKIGEFSKLSRVSIRMLRHYDEIGLLKPAEIDRFTGYRYYNPDQLPVIGRITALKDMGFQLADIVKILDVYDDRETLDDYFAMRQAELKEIAETAHYQMRLLDTARKRLRKEQNMSYNVSIKTIPERYAATVHMTIPRYEDEGLVWQILNEETAPLNVIPAEPCLVAAEYLDDEYKEEDVELVAWKTVKGDYPDTEHVKFKTLPAVKVASCMVKGVYDQMPEVYGAVISWVNDNGYECAGPMFNIYHVSPHETQNPDEFVTEVCYAVK
jgi:DNA-binding transcriptional MerR regulator